jgi:hypothetical protein
VSGTKDDAEGLRGEIAAVFGMPRNVPRTAADPRIRSTIRCICVLQSRW